MSISKDINASIVELMKKREEFELSVLRLVKSALKNAEIEAKRELTDAEELMILERQAKQRREAITQYESASRPELAEKEKKELDILEKYLPEKLTREEVEKVVAQKKAEIGATSPEDFGKLMGRVMPELKGKVDGDTVSEVVKKALS